MPANTTEDTGFKLYKLLNGTLIVLAMLTVLEGAAFD